MKTWSMVLTTVSTTDLETKSTALNPIFNSAQMIMDTESDGKILPYTSMEELHRDMQHINARLRLTIDSGKINLTALQFQLDRLKKMNDDIIETQQKLLNKSHAMLQSTSHAPLFPSDLTNPFEMSTLTVGSNNHMYTLDNLGQLFRYDHGEWKFVKTEGITFRSISVTKNRLGHHLFLVSKPTGQLYRYDTSIATNTPEKYFPSSVEWCLEPVLDPSVYKTGLKFIQVSAFSRRKIYTVTDDGSVIYYKLPRTLSLSTHPKIIEKLGTVQMKQIDVGGSRLMHRIEVWGIGMDGRIYRYDKDLKDWQDTGEELIQICATRDSAVYGLKKDGTIVKWNKIGFAPIQHSSTLHKEEVREGLLAQEPINLTCISSNKEGTIFGIEQGNGRLVTITDV